MMKEIKDYLHLYIPFQFMWVEDAVPFKKGETGLMDAEGLQYWDNYKKPILRKLSDMTEEEYNESGKITFNAHYTDTPNIIAVAEYTRYLLSKHFDLFGLIEAGLAIDKTKINQTK